MTDPIVRGDPPTRCDCGRDCAPGRWRCDRCQTAYDRHADRTAMRVVIDIAAHRARKDRQEEVAAR